MFLIKNYRDVEWTTKATGSCSVNYMETWCPVVCILKVSNSVDSLMANKGSARAAASIKPGVVPHHHAASLLTKLVGA